MFLPHPTLAHAYYIYLSVIMIIYDAKELHLKELSHERS